MARKKSHGGARVGAGRKHEPDPKSAYFTVRVEPELLERARAAETKLRKLPAFIREKLRDFAALRNSR